MSHNWKYKNQRDGEQCVKCDLFKRRHCNKCYEEYFMISPFIDYGIHEPNCEEIIIKNILK